MQRDFDNLLAYPYHNMMSSYPQVHFKGYTYIHVYAYQIIMHIEQRCLPYFLHDICQFWFKQNILHAMYSANYILNSR